MSEKAYMRSFNAMQNGIGVKMQWARLDVRELAIQFDCEPTAAHRRRRGWRTGDGSRDVSGGPKTARVAEGGEGELWRLLGRALRHQNWMSRTVHRWLHFLQPWPEWDECEEFVKS